MIQSWYKGKKENKKINQKICKNCRFFDKLTKKYCQRLQLAVQEDWFCADFKYIE